MKTILGLTRAFHSRPTLIGRERICDAPSFGIALERLRLAPYDHIVIDCPAVLGNADIVFRRDADPSWLAHAFDRHPFCALAAAPAENAGPSRAERMEKNACPAPMDRESIPNPVGSTAGSPCRPRHATSSAWLDDQSRRPSRQPGA